MRTLRSLALPLLLLSCATASAPPLSPAGKQVRTGKGDPPSELDELGPIEAVNGHGCGGFGARGTFEGAVTELRNKAASLGATYVQIFTFTEPHHAPGCYVNAFVIRGTAYGPKGAIAPVPPSAPAAAAPQSGATGVRPRDSGAIR